MIYKPHDIDENVLRQSMQNMSGIDQLCSINSQRPFIYKNIDINAIGEESRLQSEHKMRLSMSRAPGEVSLSEKALGRLGCCNGTSNDNNGVCLLF